MRLLYKSCVIFSLAFCTQAYAVEPSFYGRVDTGYSWSSDLNKDLGHNNAGESAIIGGGVGMHLGEHVRTDVTLGYRGGYDVNASETIAATTLSGSADISSVTGLVNAYYDIGHYSLFTPYIGGGIGVSSNKVDSTHLALNGVNVGQIDSHTTTSFAWQLGAGTSVDISQGVALDIGYRYLSLGSAKTADTATILGTPVSGAVLRGDLRANELQAGVRIAF